MKATDFFPLLEDERVRLQPLQEQDIPGLLPVALQPSLWEKGLQVIGAEKDLREYVRQAIREREAEQSIPFLVFDKKFKEVAGSTRFGNIVLSHKRLEIGWTWIGEKFQGTGLNKHNKFLMLQHAFEVMRMNRVEIKTDVLNEKSQRAILSLGAKEEGVFRNHLITSSGRLRNTIYFSIIKEEWPEVKKKLMEKMGK